MTELVQGSESASQSTGTTSSVAPVSSTPAPQAPAEKLLPQSEVNSIVGRTKAEAYEKGRQEALAAQNTGNSYHSANVQSQYQPPQQMGGMTNVSEQEIENRVLAKLQAGQLINQFATKMSKGQSKYPEFEAKVTALNLPNIPGVVQLANGFDNTEEIMWDLANNPIKAANFQMLSQTSPQAAWTEMQKLANSIKENQQAAANQPNIPAPLSQVKPSTAGMDNGKRSISDKRKNPKYWA